jgi:hypothetical protein
MPLLAWKFSLGQVSIASPLELGAGRSMDRERVEGQPEMRTRQLSFHMSTNLPPEEPISPWMVLAELLLTDASPLDVVVSE